MSAFDWFLAAWILLGAFLMVANVGKPRRPIEPLAAAFALLINGALIAGLLVSRGAL